MFLLYINIVFAGKCPVKYKIDDSCSCTPVKYKYTFKYLILNIKLFIIKLFIQENFICIASGNDTRQTFNHIYQIFNDTSNRLKENEKHYLEAILVNNSTNLATLKDNV